MATHISYNLEARIITVITAPTAGTLVLNVQKDIFSAAKVDWKDLANPNRIIFPFIPQGGFIISPGETLTPYYQMRAGWHMRPYEADHTLYLTEGVLVEETGADPWLKTLGGYAVNIRDVVPSDARTKEVGTTGLTSSESTQLNNIDSRTSYHTKIIDNKRALVKDGDTWYLVVYDDDSSTLLLKKALKDVTDADIGTPAPGVPSVELRTIV